MQLSNKYTDRGNRKLSHFLPGVNLRIYDRVRILTPVKARSWIRSQSWFGPLSRRLFGNSVYCGSYYDDVERLEGDSVGVMAEWIHTHMKPHKVIDVGCGPGHLMAALHERGVSVFGVDISPEAIRRVHARGLAADRCDLTDPQAVLPGLPYDLAISCEVAEHLEEKYAPVFVEKLTAAAPVVFLTAAEPGDGQGSGYHVNEQPNNYWITLLHRAGFALDAAATEQARCCFRKEQVISYLQDPLIFRRLPSGTGL